MRKKLLRSIITLCFGMTMAAVGTAQTNHLYRMPEYVEPPGWSIGMNIGMTDLWGDVGTKSVIDHYNNDKYWSSPKFMGGLYGRYTAHPALGLRMGVNFGTLYASDNFNYTKAKKAESIEDDAYQRYFRNLNVKTNVWEGQFLFEINPRRFNVMSHGAGSHFQPYLLLGVGGFHFRAKGELVDPTNGRTQWVPLDKLNLEGQGGTFADAPKKYSQWQMNVPLGLGIRWDIGRQLGLGIEYMYRYCFTDYLDNVSGNYVDPAYFSANLNNENGDAARAAALADKSYLLNPSAKHSAGEKRGNNSVKDGYSTISINFFYKVKSRKTPWWY